GASRFGSAPAKAGDATIEEETGMTGSSGITGETGFPPWAPSPGRRDSRAVTSPGEARLRRRKVLEPPAGDVNAAHEADTVRVPRMFEKLAERGRPRGLAAPAGVDGEGHHRRPALARQLVEAERQGLEEVARA